MLLLLGSIIITFSSCDKSNESKPNNPTNTDNSDYSKDKGTFTDNRDGKVYKWVKIGNQIWMAENLAYTGGDSRSGNEIRNITDDEKWVKNPFLDGWCFYKNDSSYANTYGVLYQWKAANAACPTGWHVPTIKEWNQLEDYLKSHGYSYDGITGNRYIAKSLATRSGWKESAKTGVIGNSDYAEFRNKTGFSASPGGFRGCYYGKFFGAGEGGYWWSTTETDGDVDGARGRALFYDYSVILYYFNAKSAGLSVRCVKDN